MPLAWSYCRTSTARQAGSDRSGMERQEAALARWLADHPDYELREALVDAGVSAGRGRNRTRGALARFIEGGRSGAVPSGGCLVVESMSRFSREIATTTLRTLLNDVWGAGLAISFCTDGVILDEELIAREDHRLHAVLGAIGQARAEWLERSRRSKGAAARARRSQDEGIRTDGRAPWWLARDPGTGRLLRGEDGTLVLDPDHTRSIRRAVALATAGQGMVLISRRLTEEGFIPPPTWRARNQYGGKTAPEWTAGIFSQLLAHPSLTGTLQRKGAPDLPGYYPAVITDAEHQALRASVQQRDRMKGRLRGLSSQCHNLFQGAIRCALCGGPISYAAASKRARAGHPGYLSCRAARRGAGTCSNTGTILYDQLETHCLTRLSSADWEALLHRPEDDQDRHELEQAAEQLGENGTGCRPSWSRPSTALRACGWRTPARNGRPRWRGRWPGSAPNWRWPKSSWPKLSSAWRWPGHAPAPRRPRPRSTAGCGSFGVRSAPPHRPSG